MSGVTRKTVGDDEDGMRLDRWFHRHFTQLPHGRLQKMLRLGQVRVEGRRAKASQRLQSGEKVRIPPMPDRLPGQKKAMVRKPVSARDREFVRSLVIYRDEHFLALNKPPGIAVQGGSGQERHIDALLEGLKYDAREKPRLVHRLDRDTSGVLMLARSRLAAGFLGEVLKKRLGAKLYWALVTGVPRPPRGQIEMALIKGEGRDVSKEQGRRENRRGGRNTGRGGKGRTEKMRPCREGDARGRPAITRYALLASAARRFSFLALSPVTGRTHQLRVHMNEIGHTIVGDGKYGGSQAHPGGEIARKLHLHARSFSFRHPYSGDDITIRAPLPEHMHKSWKLLGFETDDRENPFLEQKG